MKTLSDAERESLAAMVFAKTGIPLSKEDPIFALVEILKASDAVLMERIQGVCESATLALTKAAADIESRSTQLESMVDHYIQSRLEASNATLDIETKRLKTETVEAIHAFSVDLKTELKQDLRVFSEEQCIRPLQEILEIIPQRSWLENVWTLAACLAIGFATGLLYFEGGRVPMDESSAQLGTKTPSASQKQ